MKRKMLAEEKELRKYLRESVSDDYPNEWMDVRKEWGRLITALVRAVREECAKVACKTILSFEDAPNLITASERVAAAIRGGE